jgi:site-specific DNA-cytosine methylase
VIEDEDDEMIRYETTSSSKKGRSVRAATPESDFGNVESEQESDIEDEEGSQHEDSEPESEATDEGTDEGYDSGVKIRGKDTSKKASALPKPKASAIQGTSKTGRRTGETTGTEMHKLLNREKNEPKGLDIGLPPLSTINDIYKDITTKALALGLKDALKTMPRLRVATMCSGTERPLLALEMMQDALKSLGEPDLEVDHLFSAEIVPYKQAYIERNFHPKIIFRDITEITSAVSEAVPTATTVYGSKVPIPGNVHILIAGTSCVDFSRLNKHRKDLDDEAGGESSKTWYGVLSYVKAFRPAIVILENVKSAPYDHMMECYREIGYEVGGVLLDTKNYYLPQTRQRGYLVCFDKSKATTENIDGIGKTWQSLMSNFRRPASSSVADFMLPNDKIRAQQDSLDNTSKEYDWAACEIRHIQYRQEKRLGNARPLTFWSESGTMNVPENGFISWFRKRPERERDFMDISMLRKAPMFDVRYKTRIWDISQNVDLFGDSVHSGIAPCITPSGSFYISDAGRALAPEELLALQGLPLSKVSFTTESRNEIQDLAGNAVSTTAIGPAILAALISGQAVLNDKASDVRKDVSTVPPIRSKLTEVATRTMCAPTQSTEEMVLSDLLDQAHRSARRCLCESSMGVAQKPIQQCIDCGHTTCTKCGGDPTHNYRPLTDNKRASPVELEKSLRSRLPQSLTLEGTMSREYTPNLSHDKGYQAAMLAAVRSKFTFSHVRRTHVWTAVYRAPGARLELKLDSQKASWQLFALPSNTLPTDSDLRKRLEQPVAVATCDKTLLDAEWHWRYSHDHTASKVRIKGVGKRIASWLARLELPDYRNQQVWSRLNIQVHKDFIENFGFDLSGEYEALPLCGTAGDSLHKKVEMTNGEQIYLLHHPSRTGDPKLDRFVFTTEKERLDYGIQRPVIASLDATCAPWNNGKAFDTSSLTTSSHWQRLELLQLQEVDPQADVYAPFSLDQLQLDCDQAELILKSVFTNQDLDVHGSRDTDPTDAAFFAQHANILELMRRQLPVTEWRQLSLPQSSCDSCAPQKPGLRWKLTDAQAIKPYEDQASAAIYERSIKGRPQPMMFNFNQTGEKSTIQFGVNLASLAHRAVARLPANAPSRLQWKLEQDLASGDLKLGQFVLRPTEGSASPEDIGMSCRLFPKQALVLNWMQQQELGQSFTVEEAEEAIVPALGWRAEVRAETDITVRGGICADHPGFGKTITSLALIHAHLSDGQDIVADLRTRQASKGLIATQATLIVAPNNLVQQWKSEIKDKLGYTQGVLIINNAWKDLDNHSIKDFKEAKIIVVNKNVLEDQRYAERLANFAAMPGPATNSGRGFSQWLAHACKEVPANLSLLQNDGLEALRRHAVARYAELIRSEDFQAVVPSRRLVGKDYVGSNARASNSTVKAALKTVPTGSLGRPLFEQFYFNRIIVDEFHDYTPRQYACLKALRSDKRWGLSGTPALRDFYDVAQIADLLNIPLRIGSDSTRTMTDHNRKKLRKDMTDFEHFDAMREVPSDCMYARIHENAQSFLDTFVRQNVMDFDEMTYDDHLVPVTLDVDHQAAYTELSQQLASQEMNIRKAKKSKTTTRDKRFMAAIEGVDTAGEALSKDAAFFRRSGDLGKGLEHMIKARQSEFVAMLLDLRTACYAAQHELKEENQPLQNMASTLLHEQTLGDKETIDHMLQILRVTANTKALAPKKTKAKKNASESDDETEKTKEGKEISKARELTAKVNALAKGLLTTVRSKRYISNLQSIRNPATSTPCDSEDCRSTRGDGQGVAVSAHCGHRICQQCHASAKEQHRTQCGAIGCSASQQDHHLLWSHKLDQTDKASSHGAKIEAALRILEDIKKNGEKAIIFVQFPEQVDQVSAALTQHNIPATVVDQHRAGAQIASFCKNTDTVLVLNASDETAAGSNIQAANHVIFLSPLLRDNQYTYDATMAQAIGRVRRHGQTRPIHVYRICALHTIDVDILEHREHRSNALVEPGAPMVGPPVAALELDQSESKGDRVQLVKEKGSYSLRPKFWLYGCGVDADEGEMAKLQSWNRVVGWEDFSSQVKFSRAFAGDE